MRRSSQLLGLILVTGMISSAASAQNGFTPKTLVTNDGWEIHISYYPSKGGKKEDSPVVVFLHGEKQNRRFWDVPRDSWPKKLSENGYACVTVDLRRHGESNPDEDREVKLNSRDFQAMVAVDLEEVKYFIFKEHQAKKLNMRKMAVVAVDASVPVALTFAARDWLKKPWNDAPTLAAKTPRGQDVRAIVMVSPRRRVPGLSADRAILTLKNELFEVASLTIYCGKDAEDDGDGKAIAEKFAPRRQKEDDETRNYEIALGGKLRGFELIAGSPDAGKAVLNFMNKHLKSLDDEWVDRKSPVDTRVD